MLVRPLSGDKPSTPHPGGCGRGFSNRPGNSGASWGGGETLQSLLWLASPAPAPRALGRAAMPVPGVLYGRDPSLALGKIAGLTSEDSLQRGTPRSLWVSFSIYPDKYSPDPEAKRRGTLNSALPAPQKAALMGRAGQCPVSLSPPRQAAWGPAQLGRLPGLPVYQAGAWAQGCHLLGRKSSLQGCEGPAAHANKTESPTAAQDHRSPLWFLKLRTASELRLADVFPYASESGVAVTSLGR